MYTFRKLSFVLLALMIAGLMVVPTLAQETLSRTFTEDQINDSYRVNNPRRTALGNVSVDLQAGQVVISATHTYRRTSVDTITTTVPFIQDGRVYWEVVSIVTDDGQAASDDLVAQINASIMTSWRNYIRGKVEGIMTAVTITDSDITFTAEPGSRLDAAVEDGRVNEETTPGLWHWWTRRNDH
jgi:hypothetical protein